ncbi:MAG: ornithine cyclodeaminase family protein [Deltaproteobacteria bacterium]|nr:ornithine cyclodeaminase family protein [Deltaproteobacteria bacterium]
MPLYLSNQDQERAITANEAINVLENGIRQLAHGDAIRRPRIDNLIPTSRPDECFSFSSMEGGMRDPGYYALRIKPDIISWPIINGMQRRVTYCHKPGLYGGLVFLFSVDSAELLAIMNDGYVQHLRVAATAAIGVKYLAKPNAKILGMIGSGGMARSFAEAFSVVRNITTINVYSPTRANVEQYVRDVSRKVDCRVIPVDNAREAVRGADIIATCTNSYTPVIKGEWLEPGAHLANVMWREIGTDVLERVNVAGLLVRRTPVSVAGFIDDDFAIRVDVMSYAAGQEEERAKIPPSSKKTYGIKGKGRYPNARFVDCVNWETGEPYHRASDEEITTLANNSFGTLEDDTGASAGIQGIQFASVSGRVYERARQKGLGTELPREMFLQDIPT